MVPHGLHGERTVDDAGGAVCELQFGVKAERAGGPSVSGIETPGVKAVAADDDGDPNERGNGAEGDGEGGAGAQQRFTTADPTAKKRREGKTDTSKVAATIRREDWAFRRRLTLWRFT